MSAVICQIADAVSKTLNDAGAFVLPVTISSKILPFHRLTDLTAAVVDVIPAGESTERLDRVSFATSYEINVVLQKKVTAEESEVPVLLELVEQIGAALRNVVLSGDSFKAVVIGTDRADLFDADQMLEQKIFATTLTLQIKRLS